MSDQAAPPKGLVMRLLDLAQLVLSGIVRHLETAAWPRDQESADVAALRSVCRHLRHIVDAVATGARLHPNVDAAELRSTATRCTGGTRKTMQWKCLGSGCAIKSWAGFTA